MNVQTLVTTSVSLPKGNIPVVKSTRFSDFGVMNEES